MNEPNAKNRKIIEIKKWVIESGLRQREIASKLGVSYQHLNNVIHGRSISGLVEKALVDLGCPREAFEKAA